MKALKKFLNPWGILILIVGLHLFTRLYHFEQILGYGHDEDLGGWIVKDILIDHHVRLIGQETSVSSIYIAPLFYYLQVVFFGIFNMDPVGGFWLVEMISIITLASVFVVIRKFWGDLAAVFGSLVYAMSAGIAGFEQWVVPTQPTLLWSVWYIYCLFNLAEGKKKAIIGVGILWGLIWHVHIAFIPLMILVPIAMRISDKNWRFWLGKQIPLGLLIIIILNLTVVSFEVRHNFIQIHGLIDAATQNHQEVTGLARFTKVIVATGQSVIRVVFPPDGLNGTWQNYLAVLSILLVLCGWVFSRNKFGNKWWLLAIWFGVVMLAQFVSKRPISEYYFANLMAPTLVIIAVSLASLYKTKIGRISLILLGTMIVLNISYVYNRPANNEGYLARKTLVAKIALDAKQHRYPCIAINYITIPGRSAGYRYWFWLNNLKLVTGGNDVPTYSIVDPVWYSPQEITFQSGELGIINPTNFTLNPKVCDKTNRQLLPLWGFSN